MKNLVIVLLLITSGSIVAQDHIFTVLANKGQNEVLRGSTWYELKVGEKIFKGNSLRVSSEGYLGMLHKTGKTVEIKNQGEYTLAQLESSLESKSTTYSEKYSKYVFNQVKDLPAEKYEYNVVAAVDRAENEPVFVSRDTVKALKDIPLTITWDVIEDFESELHIINLTDGVLYKAEAESKTATIDLTNNSEIQENQLYFTKVFNKETNLYATDSKVKYFIMLPSAKHKNVLNEFKSLKKEVNNKKATDNLILAGFFLDKKMDSYVSSYMHMASQLNPEVDSYKKIYENYLEKTGVLKRKTK